MPSDRSRADYSRLTEWLTRHGGQIVTVSWDELDAVVGRPPSATNHYPQWWHGDRPNTRAWRAAGFELERVDVGRSVTFRRMTPPAGPALRPRSGVSSRIASPVPRPGAANVAELLAVDPRRAMLVIPCSGDKARGGQPNTRPTPATSWPESLSIARDRVWGHAPVDESNVLPAWRRYQGHFYRQARRELDAAVAAGVPVIILSGGYGLLRADEPIGIYNKVLKRSDWPQGLLESLLVDEAARVGAEAVVAFAAATTDYAKVIRRAPWRRRGISPVFHVTISGVGGGAMVEVPRRLGQAFSALWERDPGGLPAGLSVERLA
ncbi:MAG TPA: hypothetical protein VFU43_01605 [Streptosporangiaceae bacterium]|nr:hypothetical protein [Streptosporangiaceae bacterium]